MIREDFLQQNAYSDEDYTCPLIKTCGMMRCIVSFHDGAQKVISESPQDNKISYNLIATKLGDIIVELSKLKEFPCTASDEEFHTKFGAVVDQMKLEFRELADAYA